MSSFINRVKNLCNTVCSASSVGARTLTKTGAPLAPDRYNPVQLQAVHADVEVGGRPKASDQRDGAAVGGVRLEPSLAEQVARDHAMNHLQHARHQLWLCGQQQVQRDW